MKIAHGVWLVCLAFGPVAMAAPLPAAAPVVTAADPASVQAALISAGYTVTLGKDNGGDPQIFFTDKTGTYKLWFQSCTNHERCTSLQFHCEWPGATNFTPQRINDVWSRALASPVTLYVNQNGVLCANAFLVTEPGGIGRNLFLVMAKRWSTDAAAGYAALNAAK